jgi:hypothetical protein
MKTKKAKFIQTLAALFILTAAAWAQTTEFTYQGKLSNTGVKSPTYDFEFRLWDAESGGKKALAIQQKLDVPVSNDVFSVTLDFGAVPFDGSDRWLEIAVKLPGEKTFVDLTPRQKIAAVPYTIKSKSADEATNAAQLGGVDASEYLTTTTGGNAFVKNDTAQQAGANFNIAGNGIVGGNVGIGTPAPRARFHVNGSSWFQGDTTPLPATAGKGIVVGFSGEQGYISAFDYGSFTPRNLLLNLGGGSVGIGTANPVAAYVLDVNGQVVLRPGGSGGGGMTFGNPNGETGLTINGTNTNRADLRFDNSTFKMVVGPVGGPPSSTNGIAINALGNVGIGTVSPNAKLQVVGTLRSNVLEITNGSDLAEHFEVADGVKPGMVVAINPRGDGRLAVSRGAYNRRVAGIISGANGLAAGMVLPDLPGGEKTMPVALTGRVWVYCDAARGSIKPGDLLTTSNTPGHAMKVTDYARAQGAIIGKAMSSLKTGRGLVLVLVTLQ